MEHDPARKLSLQDIMSATGEPVERVRQLRALKLVGTDSDESFASDDIERVRFIQFLERRQIGLDRIAHAEQSESVLTSVIDFLFPDGVGPTYSFAQAVELVGLDPGVARRARQASGTVDELLDEHDLEMLRAAKRAVDAGFPETALLQLMRVYADALARLAEAEVRLFHFYVHEPLKASGLSRRELVESRNSMRDDLLPIVPPLMRYFHRRGRTKAVREDMVLHLAEELAHPARSSAGARLRLAIAFLDMSSYTPLTEVMGDTVAARVVERFSELVREASTRFDGRIVDRIGDAFLLIFPEPRAALVCALDIERRASMEPRFPAVRGAVHWGDLVYQEGGYVGGALNVASRVATAAAPHQILVTAAVRRQIGGLASVRFLPIANPGLKGLVEDVELFEARPQQARAGGRIRDPACGIEMDPTEIGARLTVKGEELAFCCEKCVRAFLDAPQRRRS